MGKKIIKIVLFAGTIYALFFLGGFYLQAKNPKLFRDLKTFAGSFRKPVRQAEEKIENEIIEKKPFSKEEKEFFDQFAKAKYNFPVFDKLEEAFHRTSLKDFFRKLRSSGKSKEIIEENSVETEEEMGEEEKEIAESVRKELDSLGRD